MKKRKKDGSLYHVFNKHGAKGSFFLRTFYLTTQVEAEWEGLKGYVINITLALKFE